MTYICSNPEEEEEEEKGKEDWDREILQMGSNVLQLEPHEEEGEEDWNDILEMMKSSLLQLKLHANCTAFRFVTTR